MKFYSNRFRVCPLYSLVMSPSTLIIRLLIYRDLDNFFNLVGIGKSRLSWFEFIKMIT